MEISNFELGEKLDQYSGVKFYEEFEFDSFESEISLRDALSDPLWGPNIEIFNVELEKKLYQYFEVKFDEDSEFYSSNPKNHHTYSRKMKIFNLKLHIQEIWKPCVFSGWRHALRFATDNYRRTNTPTSALGVDHPPVSFALTIIIDW